MCACRGCGKALYCGGTALVNEDREVMKALVQYKKSVDENIEYVSFLNKKWMQYLKE